MTHYEEDITIGPAVTYIAGGVPLSVVKGVLLERVDHVIGKAVSSNAFVSAVLVAPVQTSESGQAFRLKAFQVGATGALVELPAGSAALQGLPIHVSYEGT